MVVKSKKGLKKVYKNAIQVVWENVHFYTYNII